MKIAVWWEQDAWGGVDTHLLTLLRNWPDKSDRFVVFHNSGNQGLHRIADDIKKLGMVKLVPFDEPSTYLPSALNRVVRHFSLPLRFLAMKRKAQRLFVQHGAFDALLADNGNYPGAWGCLASLWAGAALGLRVRMLLIHHSAITRAALRYSIESLIDLGVQMWATDLVTVSRATRESLIERRGFFTERNPIRVIHNGVDPIKVVDISPLNLRGQFEIPVESFMIGMVGRLERYKGQEDLILALSELPSNQLSRVFAVFVGTGEPAELERLKMISRKLGVDSQIRFAGYVKGSSSMLMRQFDVLAMLTKDFEGFGMTIAEAMVAGTPVLATLVGAVPEYVTPEIALLIQPESPEQVADALVELMDHREEADQRSVRALLHIKRFTGKAMANRFHRLLMTSGVQN